MTIILKMYIYNHFAQEQMKQESVFVFNGENSVVFLLQKFEDSARCSTDGILKCLLEM